MYLFQIIKRSLRVQSSFHSRDNFVDIPATHDFVLHGAIGTNDKEGRESFQGKSFRQFFPLSLFHVKLHGNKPRVKEIAGFFPGENIIGHVFAGTTPTRVAIHEYKFIFSLGFS